MNDKGIWTNEREKALAIIVDDQIKAKGLLELVDGWFAKALITLLDDSLLEKLPIDLKPKLTHLTDLAIAKDVDGCVQLGADLLNARIDVPGIDEGAEYIMFEGALTMFVGAIIGWVKSQK